MKNLNSNFVLGSTHNNLAKLQLNPWFVTGFSDAEACFRILIQKNNKLKVG